MNESKTMSAAKAARLGIPDYALRWSPGGSLPEGAFYLSPDAVRAVERGRLSIGDEIEDPYVGSGVIIRIGDRGIVATKMFGRN